MKKKLLRYNNSIKILTSTTLTNMSLPGGSILIKQLISRTLVIALGSYLIMDGKLHTTNEHLMNGLVGSSGSIVSESFVEPMWKK